MARGVGVMKKIILSLLCITLLFSGCTGYSQEEVDSLVSEAESVADDELSAKYNVGHQDGYEKGYAQAIQDVMDDYKSYAPEGWVVMSEDSFRFKCDEQYGSGYSDGVQYAHEKYYNHIDYYGTPVYGEQIIDYYRGLCDEYGLPEYEP